MKPRPLIKRLTFSAIFMAVLLMLSYRGYQNSQPILDRNLMGTIRDGDLQEATALLQRGASPNAKGWPSRYSGLRDLIDRNGHPDYYEHRSALMFAASLSNAQMLKLLLDYGADPNLRLDSNTALSYAVDNVECVRLLLKKGIDKTNLQDGLNAAATDRHEEVIRILLGHGADVNGKDRYGWSALAHALTAGQWETFQILIKSGADPHLPSKNGIPLLISAVRGGNIEAVRFFLKRKFDVNERDEDKQTALMNSEGVDDVSIAELLIKHGADINAQDKWGMTALIHVTDQKSRGLVEFFIKHRANLNIKDKAGHTALFYAKYHNEPEIAELISKAGGKQ
ncbi:MAG: ankyrin repeat domain-containing protein [Chthonomonadaceae bacterium]|nr:ankyrin repeat domain-containing protein [Chthonomonadaceae bacterium]